MGSDDAPSPLLAAVYYEKKSQVFGLSVLDISTGYCAALTCDSILECQDWMSRLNAQEWLFPLEFDAFSMTDLNRVPYAALDLNRAESELKTFLRFKICLFLILWNIALLTGYFSSD